MIMFRMHQQTSSEVTVGYNSIRFKCLRERLEPNYDSGEKLIIYRLKSARKDIKC